jgi:hypothetical protein
VCVGDTHICKRKENREKEKIGERKRERRRGIRWKIRLEKAPRQS